MIIGPSATRDTITCPQCNGKTTEICIRCGGSGKRPEWRVRLGGKNIGERIRNRTNEEVLSGEEDPMMKEWREEVRQEEAEKKRGEENGGKQEDQRAEL